MDIFLQNTLSCKKEIFTPLKSGEVTMYNCGPTVYGVQHIGNLSMFVFTDILRRTLQYNGFTVDQVINITDFGHLSSDSDEGEDKMTKGLAREGLAPSLENMKKLAEKYAAIFLDDIAKLNIEIKNIRFPYASEYVPQQIDLIKKLEAKGFIYQISDGVYFNTEKFPNYGKLGNILMDTGESRIAVNSEKKNQRDFAVWKFGDLGWQSPWGLGFPGWHIECSAMIIALLGEQIDIHTGGIEHIAIHHNNEIAQSEAATGKSPFSKYWLHRNHLQIGGTKIAKSEGNVVYLSEIIEKGISPMALRYFLLTAHYSTSVNFTWEALEAAETTWKKLRKIKLELNEIIEKSGGPVHLENPSPLVLLYKEKFLGYINDDLDTPKAIAFVWDVVKDKNLLDLETRHLLWNFDKVLGLKLDEPEVEKEIPEEVQRLIDQRIKAREEKDWKRADELREQIETAGFRINDVK